MFLDTGYQQGLQSMPWLLIHTIKCIYLYTEVQRRSNDLKGANAYYYKEYFQNHTLEKFLPALDVV